MTYQRGQSIGLAETIAENRKAIDDGTLGALKDRRCHSGEACLYTYDDGCHCAIGVALTPETLFIIKQEDCNDEPVRNLDFILLPENKTERALIVLIQRMHDTWAERRVVSDVEKKGSFDALTVSLCISILAGFDGPIDVKMYRDFLNRVEDAWNKYLQN